MLKPLPLSKPRPAGFHTIEDALFVVATDSKGIWIPDIS